MNIILKEDMEKLGKAGEKIKVACGYARNFLIPQGVALAATPSNLKVLEQHMKVRAKRLSAIKEQAEAMAGEISALHLVFTRKSGEEGKLFGSVTPSDVGSAVLEKKIEIDKKKVLLDMPIKQIGVYKVGIKLHPEVTAEVTVEVKAEEEEKPIPTAPAESEEETATNDIKEQSEEPKTDPEPPTD